ncbi:MAG TPA: multicopper oxidase domain-containing protein [Gemmatimonadaceae bacterium]|nr:multicopper oxidase domain-containing protein [Gemmatimonadaceae bacterium]
MGSATTAIAPRGADDPALERVAPNDNRVPAGRLRDGVLTIRLEARVGSWHPDGERAPGADVPAFAEEGKAPSIPGPLIRVPAGTVVSLGMRNRVDAPLQLFGVVDRTAFATGPKDPSVRLAPGETRTIRFRLDAPGTYYYWGTTTGRPLVYRLHEDSQLTGAIVVDPPGPRIADRVMVLGMWTDTNSRAYTVRQRILTVINGRSWPNTERLQYTAGDTVRWRVVNATIDAHPMHLHGFYFSVDARGDGLVDTLYAAGRTDHVVTETVLPGATYAMSWVPERAGNWLFHCHIPDHFAHRGPLGTMPPASDAARHLTNHATEGMGGFVTGVTVLPARSARRGGATRAADDSRRRHLRLLVRRNMGGSDESPFFGFAVQQSAMVPPLDSGLHFGPPLVLVRGEPVSITVVNTLAEPTAVHWHGIELESYFDGVAGFSGSARHISPVIAPGDSFEARFTPPRAGTFIYHTHVDEDRQLLAGLAGAIVVLERGETFDPSVDHIILISSPTRFADQQTSVLLAGSASPEPLVLHANVRNRIRVVNMTVRRPVLLLNLLRDSVPVAWRLRAKDGADLPNPLAAPGEVRRTIGIGETLDFELTPGAPSDLRLDIRIGGPRPPHELMGSLAIRVVP